MEKNRIEYLIKNVGILTVSNFASKFLVFLLVPLYTSVLSTTEYGTYDVVYSTIQLLFPLLTLNISDAVMRFLMDREKTVPDVAAIGIRTLLQGTIPIVVFLAGCWRWSWIPAIQGYEHLVLLFFVFYFIHQFLIQLAKGMERVLDMGIAGILSTVFLLGGNLLLLLVSRLGLRGFYIANVAAQVVPALYLGVRVKIWQFPIFEKIDKSVRKQMLLYCLPLIVTVLGWWVNNTADKYTVVIMCGASANGLLSVAYKIPSIINVVQSVFVQAWQITAIKEYGGSDTKWFYGKAFGMLSVLMAAVCSCLIILTKPIGHVMYAKDFFAAWEYVPYLLLASVFNSAAGFLGPILSARKDSKSMAMSAVYGTVINVFLNIFLVFLIGIQGATIATAVSSFVIYSKRKKAVGAEISIAGYRNILITWGLLVIQASIEVYTQFWWAEIVLMGFMLWLNWKNIGDILGMIKSYAQRG